MTKYVSYWLKHSLVNTRKQSCTLRFRPLHLSTRRWFAPPIGIFLSHTFRSKIITPWDMSQYQNFLRITLETSVYLYFQVCFFLAMRWKRRLDTAAEETWYEVNFLSTARGNGKASLKRQKSLKTTTDTQDVSKFYWFYVKNVHISIYLS